MTYQKHIATNVALVALLCLFSCRDEKDILMPETEQVTTETVQNISGFYLLNEGNMGSNKATIDYFDYTSGSYTRNIYAEANPTVVQELGDVGTDLQIYGSKMYAVVNCSNLIEVMDVHTARHIGTISLPNCRYIRFSGGYGYATSYAGEVSTNSEHAQIGYVAKIDTATLQIVATCNVGYQPDELEIANNRIYVANSGGYMQPHYDKTLSVIDLDTFQELKRIEVACNLFRVRADEHNQLWVSSRGNYSDVPSRLYCVSLQTEKVTDSVNVSVSSFDIVGDTIWIVGNEYNTSSGQNTNSYSLVDVNSHKVLSDNFITDGTEAQIKVPYNIKLNKQTNEIFITDAKDYVSPGTLYCLSSEGKLKWSVSTGDIPSAIAFVSDKNEDNQTQSNNTKSTSRYLSKVYEYCPAPGQFVNQLPAYEDGDDATTMAQKCTAAIAGNASGMVTLGAFGGYITFGFDHSIINVSGEPDIYIRGNAFTGNSEAGIVMVSVDENANGEPDDTWYELSGSADADYASDIVYGYSITYTANPLSTITWTDNIGRTGTIDRNQYHQQEYFPLWMGDELTLSGTLLPSNISQSGTTTILNAFSWGYADNLPNSDEQGNSFDISNAVEPLTRQPINLSHIDFVRVYSALCQKADGIGETSTEVCGATDLHFK